MKCECGNDTFFVEKRSRNGSWYFVYICRKCQKERLPTPEEKIDWNG